MSDRQAVIPLAVKIWIVFLVLGIGALIWPGEWRWVAISVLVGLLLSAVVGATKPKEPR